MKKPSFVLASLVALALCVGIAVVASAAPGKLKCFSGAPATCSVSQDTVTLDTSTGGFAGGYVTNSKNPGASLGGVTYSFQYNCDPSDNSTDCVGGGSPRWSIPISAGGSGNKVAGYAFLDAAGCGSNGTVSTASPSCAVTENADLGGNSYANWAAFAAANPTFKIGNALPFVITDTTEPGTTLIFAISST